jgi:hypothetical protein
VAIEKMKVDHGGPKNGGGFYGTRSDAKRFSKRLRRGVDRHEIARQRSE